MSERNKLEVKKDWMDYANLAANIHQSFKLGEISNQLGGISNSLNDLTSINTEMLGGLNYLVDVEVYKLEKEGEEKDFKQLIFNINKFLKNKYEDSLTICLLKYGHCDMISSLLKNFQKELKSFEEKEYVEKLIDNFEEYSSIDIDLETLAKDEDDTVLLISYLMMNGMITLNQEKIESTKDDIGKVRSQYITPMQKWTYETLNKYLEDIGSEQRIGQSLLKFDIARLTSNPKSIFNKHKKSVFGKELKKWIEEGQIFQLVFKPNGNKKIASIKKDADGNIKSYAHNSLIKKIEKDILPSLTERSTREVETLSKELKHSLKNLSDDLKKSDSSWISVEKQLLNILYNTKLPIHEPYQYRKQILGD